MRNKSIGLEVVSTPTAGMFVEPLQNPQFNPNQHTLLNNFEIHSKFSPLITKTAVDPFKVPQFTTPKAGSPYRQHISSNEKKPSVLGGLDASKNLKIESRSISLSPKGS